MVFLGRLFYVFLLVFAFIPPQSRGEQSKPRPVLENLDSLKQKESEIESLRAQFVREGFSMDQVRARIHEGLRGFSSEELSLLGGKNESSLSAQRQSDLAALRAYLTEAVQRQMAFQKAVDEFTAAQVRFFVENSYGQWKVFEEDLRQSGWQPKNSPWEQLTKEFEGHYVAFKKMDSHPKRMRADTRNSLVRSYFDSLGKLLDQANGLPEKEKQSSLKRLEDFWVSLPESANMIVDLSPSLVRFAAELSLRSWLPPKPGSTPTLRALDSFLKNLAKNRNMKIEVEGREHIPTSQDPKEINVLTLVHRDIYLDQVIASHLDLPEYHIFVDHQRFVKNKALAEMIRHNPDFLPVGEESHESVNRMFEHLHAGGVRNLVILPERTTSLVGETNVIEGWFVRSFLDKLRKEGYKVNLIPISTFMEPGVRSGNAERVGRLVQRDYEIKVKVHPRWSPAELELLRNLPAESTGVAVNLFIRSEWIENQPTNEQVLLGQFRAQSLGKDLGNFLQRRVHGGAPKECVAEYLRGFWNP